MKAISLTQPWATLVAIGAKAIETRSWSTQYRGSIAIHASKGFPKWARETCEMEPFESLLRHAIGYYDENYWKHLPLGCVVAKAELIAVIPTWAILKQKLASEREQEFGDFGEGRFGWILRNVEMLENPVPCKGALGLWDWAE